MSTVTARLGSDTQVTLHARQFSWGGDEPPIAGGTDTGPTPYEMLLGSLASCIALTLRVYARHKKIALDGVDVSVEFDCWSNSKAGDIKVELFDRVHGADCEDCDERADGWIDRIQTHVTIRGVFDESQKTRLAQVASRCPVHKTLANGAHIVDAVGFVEKGD